MKRFYKCLREHVMEITNFKKTKIKLLTNEQQKSDKKCQNFSYFFKKFEVRYAKDKKYRKVMAIANIQLSIEELGIAYII